MTQTRPNTHYVNSIWRLFRTKGLTRAQRDVLLKLPTFRARGGGIFPSHATLGDRAGCCSKTVERALAAGSRAGLVSWRARWRRVGARAAERTSNWYHLAEKPGKPFDGQNVGVTFVEETNPSFLLTFDDPLYARAREDLARIARERASKIAQEWQARRS